MPGLHPDKRRIHHGRNIRRIREMLGTKQEALAWELGEEWSQKRVSIFEQKEVIPEEIQELFAQALKVPIGAIRNFDEETILNHLHDNYNSPISNLGFSTGFPTGFNPIEKWISAIEENERLYERLLKSEQEKVILLQKILNQCLRE